MNLNELFYFKTILCPKKENHDYDLCYFYHANLNDIRRIVIDFSLYFNTPDSSDLDPTSLTNNDNINIDKNLLKFYTNEIGFQDEILNQMLFKNSPCRNSYEHKYHILNYKTNVCSI